MSFREVRSFCEIMRYLGYPRLISMENFREPNFPLVADCLEWLVRRYDQGAVIAGDIDTATDRVLFLQTIGRTMFAKARIKLNLRKLYTADGHAVRELLKVARLLYDASRSADKADISDADAAIVASVPIDAAQMRQVRALAAEVQAVGNQLQDALQHEGELSRARAKASFATDSSLVEEQLREAVQAMRQAASNKETQAREQEKEQKTLEAKLKKRGDELARQRQRLVAVRGVRPAFMAEHEKLQEQLGSLFAEYLDRHRNLEYLQRRLGALEAQEEKDAEEDERRMRKAQAKMQREMAGVIGGNHEVDDSGFDSMESGDIEFSAEEDSMTAGDRGVGGDTMRRPMQPGRGAKRPSGQRSQPVGGLGAGAGGDDSSASASGLSDDNSDSAGVSFGSGDSDVGPGDKLGGFGGDDDDPFGEDEGIYDDSDSSDGGF